MQLPAYLQNTGLPDFTDRLDCLPLRKFLKQLPGTCAYKCIRLHRRLLPDTIRLFYFGSQSLNLRHQAYLFRHRW